MRRQDSSVGIATRCGLDCPGNESRWGRDIPHPSIPSLLYNRYRVFPGGKAAGAWRWPPPPPFGAQVQGRVELYVCSPSRPSWPVLGWTLPYLYLGWGRGRVGATNRSGLDDVRGSNPASSKRFSLLRNRLDWGWGATSFLCVGWRSRFSGAEEAGSWLRPPTPMNCRSKFGMLLCMLGKTFTLTYLGDLSVGTDLKAVSGLTQDASLPIAVQVCRCRFCQNDTIFTPHYAYRLERSSVVCISAMAHAI
jgi:hypothetical protein